MRIQVAAIWVALQILFFGGWAWTEAARFEEGHSILVRTAPVDPRDLLRGQYMRLAYPMSRPGEFENAPEEVRDGSTIWTVLVEDGEFHTPAWTALTRPQQLRGGAIALRGRIEGRNIVYGIERYFVPEGTPTPREGEITVRLRVAEDGIPRIEEVYLDGQPWP